MGRKLVMVPLVAIAALAIAAATPRQVLVASRDIPDGDFLHNDMFEVRWVPAYRIPLYALTRPAEAVGRLANRPIPRGRIVVSDDRFGPSRHEGDGALARLFFAFLPSPPAKPVVSRDLQTLTGKVDVSVEMASANAPLLVAGMFVDFYDGPARLAANVQIASVEMREGNVVVMVSVYSDAADRLIAHAATLRFELAGTTPRFPPTPLATPTVVF